MTKTPRNGITAIAVIGMACRLPGAPSKEAFWKMQLEGRSNYSELPPDRLDRELYYSPEKDIFGKSYSQVGAAFDCSLESLRSDGRKLISEDPGHAVAHDVALEACRDAGYSVEEFPFRRAGVFMGCTRLSQLGCNHLFLKGLPAVLDYMNGLESFAGIDPSVRKDVLREASRLLNEKYEYNSRYDLRRLASKLAAWNIAETLNLDGPAQITDAACSSSLAALANASRALSAGTIDAAFVGGNSFFSFDSLVLFSKAQSVATELSCPFDKNASGLICGEAQVFFLLKTYDKALADGDRIYGVIRGIGASTDGKGKTLWAPRKEGQTEAVLRAFGNTGADPKRLRFIEAHATSTPLGDPTEMAALGDALKSLLPEGRRIHVGSVKANVGHTLEAAGAVGLLKVLLMLKYKVIPPQINVETLNDAIHWNDIPLDLPMKPLRLTRSAPDQPIQLAVNAFGIGGINYHIIVEEHRTDAVDTDAGRRREPHPTTPPEKTFGAAEPVAIIGMGCVVPGANNVAEFAELLREGKNPKTEYSVEEWDRFFPAADSDRPQALHGKTLRGGFIRNWKYDWRKYKIAPLQISRANPLQFMILDAVDQALTDAGFETRAFDRKRTAVLIGSYFGGDFGNSLQIAVQWPEIRQAVRKALERQHVAPADTERILAAYEKKFFERISALHDETGSFTSSTLASRVTKTFDFMGGAISVDAGGVASPAILESALNMIRSGECDTVVCVGAQRSCGTTTFEVLAKDGSLASKDLDPLDPEADGVFPGEGVGVVLLKSLRRAVEDGDRVHAVIHGVGSGSAKSEEESVDRALRAAYDRSRIDAGKINLFEMASYPRHENDGTTLPLRRFAELLKDRNEKDSAHRVGVGSLAGRLGDLGGANGMVSLIKAVLAMEKLEIPGIVGLQKTPTALDGLPFRANQGVSPFPSCNEDGRLFASVFNIDRIDGFAVSYNVVLERGAPVPEESRKRISGNKKENETKSIEPSVRPVLPVRNANVSKTPNSVPESVVATTGDQFPSRWAMIFPGQGAQYHGMLRPLAEASSRCREIIASLDETLRRLEFPTFASMVWEEPNRLGKDVFLTQLSLLVCDTVFARWLNDDGVFPSLYFGHSYGEYPALVAAGGWSFETAAIATQHRCRAVESLRGRPSGMLSTDADSKLLERLFAKIDSGRLFVSNRNTPTQTVVSGEIVALNELDAAIKREKRSSMILPVPAGYHSPLVEDVCDPLRDALTGLTIHYPDNAFLSGVTGRFEAEPSILRAAFVEQMVRPVDFVALIEKAYRNGVRRFVEAGPKSILANMGQKILADESVVFLSCDIPKGNGEAVLARLEEIAALYRRDRTTEPENRDSVVVELRPQSAPIIPSEKPATTPTTKSSFEPQRNDLPLPADMLCLELSGTPFEIGLQAGGALKTNIRNVLARYADVAGQPDLQLPDVSVDMGRVDRLFTADALEELRGIAQAAGVPLTALIRHNLSVYPDSTAATLRHGKSAKHQPALGLACTCFAGRTCQGDFLQGANIDVPIYRMLPGSHVGLLQVRRPIGKKAHVLASGSGFVGGIFGLNAAGLSVVGASLSDLPRTPEISEGLVPTLLIERILSEAGNLEEAVALIRSTSRTASWSLCIAELASGRMVQVEYSGKRLIVRDGITLATSANHQQFLGDLLPKPLPAAPAHSIARLDRLHELLKIDADHFQVDADGAFTALRDKWDSIRQRVPKHRTINTIWRIDNTLSLLVDVKRGVLRLASTDVNRTDADDTPGRYAEIPLRQLLPELDVILNAAANAVAEPPTPPEKTSRNELPVLPPEEYARLNTSRSGKESISVPLQFNRYVLRMVETEIPSQSIKTVDGAALIVAEAENPFARELAEHLSRQSVRFFQLSPEQPIETIAGELDRIDKESPLTTVFFLGATDSDSTTRLDAFAWEREYEQATVLPIVVLKEWVRLASARGNLSSCVAVAPLRLGGDFGLAGKVDSTYSGALSGLLKGLAMELGAAGTPLRIKLVDQENDCRPECAAEQLLFETRLQDKEQEVAYVGGRRFVLRSVPAPLDAGKPRNVLSGSLTERWIVTGGARGITAAIAHGIGKARNASLILVGSSPLPQIDPTWKNLDAVQLKELRSRIFKEAAARKEVPVKAWERVEKALEIDRNLDAMKRDGIEFSYHACDLTDSDAVRRLIDSIVGDGKSLTGVVHGAGFEQASLIRNKKIEGIRKTFDVKVKGAATLLRVLEERNAVPSLFIGFSSVSGRFGGVGQVDYCSANEMLAKLLDWYDSRDPSHRAFSFHWPAWGEIGMAARPESKLALQVAGLEFMPPSEGVAHVLNEIERNLDRGPTNREREILVVDWNYYKRFYPDGSSIPAAPVASKNEKTAEIATSRSMIVVGDNADAETILEQVRRKDGLSAAGCSEKTTWNEIHAALHAAMETGATPTLVLTVPRDPVAGCLRGERHWNERLNHATMIAARCCSEWIDGTKTKSNAKLLVLVSLGRNGLPYFPEGAVLVEWLKTRLVGSNVDFQVLDFAENASTKLVAKTVLTFAGNAAVPGRREMIGVETDRRGDLRSFERPSIPFGNWTDTLAALDRAIESPSKTQTQRYVAPLFDEIVRKGKGSIAAMGTLRPLDDVFLREHRMNHKPILPMVVALEAFSETITSAVAEGFLPAGSRLIGFDRFQIAQGLVCRTNDDFRYNIHCEADSADKTKLRGVFSGDYYDALGRLTRTDKVYSTTDIRIALPGETSKERFDGSPNLPGVPDQWIDTWYPDAGDIQIYHGPAFRCLKRGNITGLPNTSLIELRVPDPMQLLSNGPESGRRLHVGGTVREMRSGAVTAAAIIDSVLFGCGLLYWYYHNDCVCIPLGIDGFRFGPGRLVPGEKAYGHLLLTDHGDMSLPPLNRTAGFDFSIRNAAGEIAYDIKGYRATILKKPS